MTFAPSRRRLRMWSSEVRAAQRGRARRVTSSRPRFRPGASPIRRRSLGGSVSRVRRCRHDQRGRSPGRWWLHCPMTRPQPAPHAVAATTRSWPCAAAGSVAPRRCNAHCTSLRVIRQLAWPGLHRPFVPDSDFEVIEEDQHDSGNTSGHVLAPLMRSSSWPSTRSARCRWTRCRRPTRGIPARRWRWPRWPTSCGGTTCGSTRSCRCGRIGTGSCFRSGTPRRCCTRCCTWPG